MTDAFCVDLTLLCIFCWGESVGRVKGDSSKATQIWEPGNFFLRFIMVWFRELIRCLLF